MSYTCPVCRRTSHAPNDEQYQYCGFCHVFEEDLALVQAAITQMHARYFTATDHCRAHGEHDCLACAHEAGAELAAMLPVAHKGE